MTPLAITADLTPGEITGTLRNTSDQHLTSLTLGFSLYDQADAKLADVTDSLALLKAGESWAFRCRITEPTTRTARFLGFTSSAKGYPVNFQWVDRAAMQRQSEAQRDADRKKAADEADAVLRRLQAERAAKNKAESARQEEAGRNSSATQANPPKQ